ncbi:multi-sensor hybrid histidine kinase [gamma proteobacterium IMCC2047]|nr:multi-sensor hybrid histidine kinase [gamma proteobacterium IMCC2047]
MQTTDKLSGKFIGDSERLGQVLNYLLNNAVKFSSKGDSVTLSVFPQKKQKNDLLVQFSIKDTGIGIAKDKQAELFKPFYQVDAETNRKFDGAGMGLAMARRFVGIMGGDIWLESELNQGSTFHFTLLLQKDKG